MSTLEQRQARFYFGMLIQTKEGTVYNTLVHPKENTVTFNLKLCVLSFGHRLQTEQHRWSHYLTVNLSFHFCCYYHR